MPVSLAISATLVSGVRLRRTVSPVSSLPQLGIQSTYPSTGWRGYRALIPAWPHQHTIGRAAQISQNEHAHNCHQVCLLFWLCSWIPCRPEYQLRNYVNGSVSNTVLYEMNSYIQKIHAQVSLLPKPLIDACNWSNLLNRLAMQKPRDTVLLLALVLPWWYTVPSRSLLRKYSM